MGNPFQFADVLGRYLERTGYNVSQLARLSGIPQRTLANWLAGHVKRPRELNDLLNVARILQLNESEATNLLQAARHPSLEELIEGPRESGHRELLTPWLETIRYRQTKSPFQAISDLPYFVGREEEVETLTNTLLAGHHVTICSLQGMGGIGKTALAARLAYLLQPHFPDGVLWARVDISDTMTILSTFAHAYGHQVSQYSDLGTRSQVVRELLAKKRALIVLDNAQDSETVSPLLPPAGPCAVIITTRRHDLFVTTGTYRLKVGPFSQKEEESLRLFAKLLSEERVEQEKPVLNQIADLLGHLPLAIAIAASRLAYEPGWTTKNLLQQLHHHQGRLDTLTYGNQSVWVSADLSYAALTAGQQRVFAALGAFASETINVTAVAAMTGLSLVQTQNHLRQLYNLSLVQTGQHKSYRLHPLLHDYAREQLESIAEQCEILARMVIFFVNYMETHPRDYLTLEKEVDNILRALEVAFTQEMHEMLVRGTIAFCHFGEARGLYRLLEKHLERACQAAVTLGDDAGHANLLFYQGYIQRRRGRYQQAEPYFRESLILARQAENHRLTARVSAELGIVIIHKGKGVEGEARLQESLALARDLDDKELIILCLTYVGACAGETGQTAEAEAYYQEGLSLARLMENQERVGTFLNNLGALAARQDNVTQAERYYQQAMALAEACNFQSLRITAGNNLGELTLARSKHKQAKRYFQEALMLSREIEHNELTMHLLYNLGQLCAKQGNEIEAETFYQEALSIAQRLQMVGQATSLLLDLGTISLARGDHTGVKAYYGEICTLAYQAKERQMISTDLYRWGEMCLTQNVPHLALPAFEVYLEIGEEENRLEQIALATYGLARVAAARSHITTAGQYGQKSLALLEALNHDKTTEVKRWLDNLGY